MSHFVLKTSSCLMLGLLTLSASSQETPAKGLEAYCDEFSGNPRRSETICVGFMFNDGTSDISAGRATTNAFDIDVVLWRLTDGVRLASGSTEILADEALARLESDELVLGELIGSPVTMSDYIEERQIHVEGRAQSLSYDSRSGDVYLSGEAILVVGDNEVMGCEWIYNVIDKSYRTGDRDDCDVEGVRLLFTSPEESDEPRGQSEEP